MNDDLTEARDINGAPTPTVVLALESVKARELAWLPLAVRFKLDQCGQRIGLLQWQGLSLAARRALLSAPEGPQFERLLNELFGMQSVETFRRGSVDILESQAGLTAFQRYVLRKLEGRDPSREC